MKPYKSVITLLTYSLAILIASAQLSLPTKRLGDDDYYYHKVNKKETLYSITHQLGVTQEQIYKYNPSTKDGLKAGQVLYFPVSAFSKTAVAATATSKPAEVASITHTVQKGETLYGISKTYGVTQESLVKANPDAEGGVKTGQQLVIPQGSNATTTVTPAPTTESTVTASSDLIYHKIKAGETLYSVAKQYNTTMQDILAANPGVSAQNFRYDEVIRVRPNTDVPVEREKEALQFFAYTVKKGDTFYSIATSNGITVELLQEANPSISKLKKGQTVIVPKPHTETVLVKATEADEKEAVAKMYADKNDTLTIAIIQPFMLNEEKPGSTALNSTEFFKGFMLATDSLYKSNQRKLKILAIDNENSLEKTKAILRADSVKGVEMIIAPPDQQQLNAIGDYAKKHKVYVINALAIKDDSYTSNPYMLQGNIPPSYMAAALCDWCDKKFSDRTMIFIDVPGQEKKDTYNALKRHLDEKGKHYIHIEMSGASLYTSLNDKLNPGAKYVVLASSAQKSVAAKLLTAIKKLKQNRIDTQVSLLGYPEYVTYQLDHKDDFHKADTYIYSRFFYDSEDAGTKQLEHSYKTWYGENMRYAAPKMGLLGFDTGYYFLSMLSTDRNAFTSSSLPKKNGLQSNMKYQRVSNWSGFINKNLQFVHFTPAMSIIKE